MEKASDILKILLDEDQLKDAQMYSSFFKAWKQIAGDKAAHSRIVDIVRNAVIIEADHPGWMQLLKMEEKRILKTLQKRYPQLEIRSLRFVLGNRSGASVVKTEKSISPTNSEEIEHQPQEAIGTDGVDKIDDPRLKLLLKKLGKAIVEKDS